MQFDKLTLRSREAVEAARRLAEKSRHQELDPEHLLFVLAEDQEGVVRHVLDRLGADTTALRAAVTDAPLRLTGPFGRLLNPFLHI